MVDAYRLYLLETIMSSHNCMPLNNLWTCFTSRFPQNAEFLSIVGPDITSFEGFLKQYPSLFKVKNFIVTLADNCDGSYELSSNSSSSDLKFKPRKREIIFEFNFEQEAVKYFQEALAKRSEKWIPIKSLSSHISHASNKIRLAIGPQGDFSNFLSRHPLVFDVQGDLVGLKEDYKNASAVNNNLQNQHSMVSSNNNSSSATVQNNQGVNNVVLRNKKMLSCKKDRNSASMRASNNSSLGNRRTTIYCDGMADFMNVPNFTNRPFSMAESSTNQNLMQNQDPILGKGVAVVKKNSIIALSISEFKAISWLRSILLRKSMDGTMNTTKLMQNLIEANESIHGIVGTTQVELVEFLSKHPLLFNFDEATKVLSLKPTQKLHLIIIEDRQTEENTYTLNFKKGCVFCITKLWGIIDLGFHEHVFFDRSLFKNVTDLTKHFKTGEALYFNAVLASKESRAKWRAIRVWKETDKVAAQLVCRQNSGFNYQNTENGLVLNGSEWDSDSGYDNVIDEYLSQTRKSNYPIDPRSLHEDANLFSLLFVETVDLPECLSAFSSVRMADPWEVSSIIAQGPESLVMLQEESEKLKFDAVKMDDNRSSLASSISESDMNTMSGVPSLAQQDVNVSLYNNGKLDEKMSTLSISSSGYASTSQKSYKNAKKDLGSPVTALTPAAPKKKMMATCAATQTVFTGDIMATQLFHDDGLNS